jgi:uncharacterized protein
MKNLNNTTGTIRTFSGKLINVFDPKPEGICIEDIAHALSNLCRFGGHTSGFYSVAQHCCLMAKLVSEKPIALATLLHDASEAYLLDISRPIKHLLPQYQEAEHKLMHIIAEKFGFEYPLPAKVTELDNQFLEIEWEWLMLNKFRSPHLFITWSPGYAEQQFLYLYNLIISNLKPTATQNRQS